MKKKTRVLIAVVAVVVAVGGYYIIKNKDSPSVGINDQIIDESKKEGTTTLDSSRVLVVYFSHGGNTQKLAKEVFDQVGGDFRRIEPVNPYPQGDVLYDDTKAEQEKDARPSIEDLDIDMSQYDTIFIGYPIWWYTYPQIILSFFDTYDVSNKTIIPFVSHGGSEMSGTKEDMINYLENKKVKVLDGLAVSRDVIEQDQRQTVSSWLDELGIKK